MKEINKFYKKQDPPNDVLSELYEEHKDKFEDEYRQKLFQLGEKELVREAMNKYARTKGQSTAKISFLALNSKSQRKILNAYFKDETGYEKMDNLVDRLKLYKVFNP